VINDSSISISNFGVSAAGIAALDLNIEGDQLLYYFNNDQSFAGVFDYDHDTDITLLGLTNAGSGIAQGTEMAAIGTLDGAPGFALLELATPQFFYNSPLSSTPSGIAYNNTDSMELYISFQAEATTVFAKVVGDESTTFNVANLIVHSLAILNGRLYAAGSTAPAQDDSLFLIDLAAGTASLIASPEIGHVHGFVQAFDFIQGGPNKSLMTLNIPKQF